MRLVKLALLVFLVLSCTTLPASAVDDVPQGHFGQNCNIISNPGGQDQTICIMVNVADIIRWREALGTFCDGSRGAKEIFIKSIWLEQNGRVTERSSIHAWRSICYGALDAFSTKWDKGCRPDAKWQAHMTFYLRWYSGGGATNLKSIHSAVTGGGAC